MPPTIPQYDFQSPTAHDLSSSLVDVVGPQDAEAALGLALRDLELPADALTDLSGPRLLDLSRALTRQRGLVAIIARSFSIRLNSYIHLGGMEGQA